jgi:hypothetical protein
MKTVTVEQALAFGWCYSEEKIRALAGDKTEWTALDVLRLTSIPAKDRQYAVLSPEFLEDNIMHEFACLCTEDVLAHIDTPDSRSVRGIETKRCWMRGEATDAELDAAHAAACAAAWDAANAAAWGATEFSEYAVAWAAANAAANAVCLAAKAAADAACAAADAAACAAAYAAANAVCSAAWNEAKDAAHERQVEMLIKLLEEAA